MVVKIFIATLLTIIPFIWVNFFEDKKKGFLYVLFFLSLFHIALGFITQIFGIFYYSVILTATIIALIICVTYYFYIARHLQKQILKISSIADFMKKIDWVLLAVILISVLSLYQVHYNYTGKMSMVDDGPQVYHQVENMKYVYPYFSDEWYSVSLINGVISSGGLPLKNTLTEGFFLNLQLFSHSFLAEIIVFAGLDPLLHYTLLSIAVNTLIIILAYLFLRIIGISGLSSALSSLAILYITSGANLPGIWNLIPVTLGILFSLMLFCFIALSDVKMVALALLPISLFYTLLLPFYGMGAAIFLLSRYSGNKERLFVIISWSIIIFLMLFLILSVALLSSQYAEFTKYIFSRLFYYNLFGNFVPQLNIFYIIPVPVILLALISIPILFKNYKWFLAQITVGGVYWVSYFFTNYRFILEFERAVFFTSILISLAAGFGLESLAKYFKTTFDSWGVKVFNLAKVSCLIALLLFIPFYTRRENWINLTVVNYLNGQKAYPRAPANNYLTKEDIRIFEDIKEKRFLSVPWKGTVIGVATQNYPVVTKEGTISLGKSGMVNSFMTGSCESKDEFAVMRRLDYVYLPPFQCPNFEKINESSEGFVLYKVLKES